LGYNIGVPNFLLASLLLPLLCNARLPGHNRKRLIAPPARRSSREVIPSYIDFLAGEGLPRKRAVPAPLQALTTAAPRRTSQRSVFLSSP